MLMNRNLFYSWQQVDYKITIVASNKLPGNIYFTVPDPINTSLDKYTCRNDVKRPQVVAMHYKQKMNGISDTVLYPIIAPLHGFNNKYIMEYIANCL